MRVPYALDTRTWLLDHATRRQAIDKRRGEAVQADEHIIKLFDPDMVLLRASILLGVRMGRWRAAFPCYLRMVEGTIGLGSSASSFIRLAGTST